MAACVKLFPLLSCADFPLKELHWHLALLFVVSPNSPPTPNSSWPLPSALTLNPRYSFQMVQSNPPTFSPSPPPPLIEGMNESEAFQHIPAADWWPSTSTSHMKIIEINTTMMKMMVMMMLMGMLVLDGAAAQQQQGE